MKLLLYCTKSKPYLIHESGCYDCEDMCCDYNCFSVVDRQELYNQDIPLDETYNGKIVGECDFEVEEICSEKLYNGVGYEPLFYTETIDDILKKSCLTQFEIENYLGCKAGGEVVGYAIHIKNLNIFYTPKELSAYNTYKEGKVHIANIPIYTAPQNMMYAFDYYGTRFVLISIRPEWLCKILNGEKTIEVRKKVLKEMLNNEKDI